MRLVLYAMTFTASLACGVSAASGARDVAQTSAALSEAATATSAVAGDASAIGPCAALHPSLQLIGAFESTAADVANWVENVSYPDLPHVTRSAFRSYPAQAPIYACYFAGLWNPPIGPPGAACPVSPASRGACPTTSPDTTVFDRALYFVDAHRVELFPSKIASAALLPVQRPGGRF